MDADLHNFCPHCGSNKLIKNGHPHGGKHEYICKSCKRYFTKDSLKSYPPTNIPFPVIAYLLYFRRKVPELSNMRKYRPFVNYWLKYLEFYDHDISRQSIHHWFNNFDKLDTFLGKLKQKEDDFMKILRRKNISKKLRTLDI